MTLTFYKDVCLTLCFTHFQLLNRESDKRLGTKGADEVKGHAYFRSMDWDELYEKKIKPSFVPPVVGIAYQHYIIVYLVEETKRELFYVCLTRKYL